MNVITINHPNDLYKIHYHKNVRKSKLNHNGKILKSSSKIKRPQWNIFIISNFFFKYYIKKYLTHKNMHWAISRTLTLSNDINLILNLYQFLISNFLNYDRYLFNNPLISKSKLTEKQYNTLIDIQISLVQKKLISHNHPYLLQDTINYIKLNNI